MNQVRSEVNVNTRTYRDSAGNELKPVATMVERFVQSLSNANDSGSFDTSLEVKSIIIPHRKRTKCLTELDREDLMKFVMQYEARKQLEKSKANNVSTPKPDNLQKNVDYSERIYANSMMLPTSTPNSNNQEDHTYVEMACYDSDFESTDQEFDEDDNDPLNRTIYEAKTPERPPYQITEEDLRRRLMVVKKTPTNDRQCKAARILNFLSSARRKMRTLKSASCNTSRNASPLPSRCKRVLIHSDTEDDDGISTGSQLGSRNISPDSSFELHAPIVPTFKLTPPPPSQRNGNNPAADLARILRGSFQSKRATISTLRRSISDPDNFKYELPQQENRKSKEEFVEARTTLKRGGLGAAMIRNLDVLCGSRKLLNIKQTYG